jgi:tight adherence protein B
MPVNDTNTATQPPEVIGLLKENARFAPDEPRTSSDRFNRYFDDLVEQSGIETTPGLALVTVLAIGMIAAGAMFVWQENMLSVALGLGGGVGMSILFLNMLRNWRFGQVQRQLPDALAILNRNVRAGRSLEQGIEELGRELPSPLADEFKRISVRLAMGLPLAAAVRELPKRMPLGSVRVFATAMILHQHTGGNLTHALDKLAQTIRDRAEFRGRYRAATAGSRFAVIFLLAIGPLVMVYQSFRQSQFLSQLTSEPTGQKMLIAAIALQVIGSLVVLNIFRSGMKDTEM